MLGQGKPSGSKKPQHSGLWGELEGCLTWEAFERQALVVVDVEESLAAGSQRQALSWHVWTFFRSLCPLLVLPPEWSPGALISFSLIYSLFYLYVWSRTLASSIGQQMLEGISPR